MFHNIAGDSQRCREDKFLSIKQSATGKLVKNKKQWNVTISNDCDCTRLYTKLSCRGFKTVEDIDPEILSKSGSQCDLQNVHPIYARDKLNFTYAWDTAFHFKLLSSTITRS